MEKIKPVCRFDPQNPAPYRDAALLRSLLAEVFPGLRRTKEKD
jgi:hypothetical protein